MSPYSLLRQPTAPVARRGFTLVELLLVLSLLLVLTAVALPGLTGWQARLPLDQAIGKLQLSCQEARLRAIRSGMTYVIQLEANGEGRFFPAHDEHNDSRTPETFQLSQDVVRVECRDLQRQLLPQLMFYPAGHSSSAHIVLTDSKGRSAHLQLDRLTGVATASEFAGS